MTILQKLTLRQLMRNKRRTLVTILGVIISVAMITATASGIFSGLKFLRDSRTAAEGEWHIRYSNGMTAGKVSQIPKDSNTEVYFTAPLGFGKLPSPKNPRKPYVYVEAMDSSAQKHLPMAVRSGHLPEKEDELAVTPSLLEAAGSSLNVGDTITFELGQRVFQSEGEDREYELSQYTQFRTGSNGNTERLVNTQKHVYRIVGIIEEPEWFASYGPGILAITTTEAAALPADLPVEANVVKVKPTLALFEEAERTASALDCDAEKNHTVLATYLVIKDPAIAGALSSVCTALFGLIMIVGVSLIYNAFAISVTERSKQLGMLASVGATRLQKRNSILLEGVAVALVSIPLGIGAGLLGLFITFRALSPLFQKAMTEFSGVHLQLVVNPTVLALSVVFSLITIFISVYRPALTASRTTAIDALRQSKDIRLKAKSMKTSRLVNRLFGMEGGLALKNLKRNGRRYQVTTVSLVMSIVLFLGVFGFSSYMQRMIDFSLLTAKADLSMHLSSRGTGGIAKDTQDRLEEEIKAAGPYKEYWSELSTYVSASLPPDKVTADFLNANQEQNGACGFSIEIIVLSDAKMKEKMQAAGISELPKTENGISGIMVNRSRVISREGTKERMYLGRALNLKKGERIPVSYFDENKNRDTEPSDLVVAGVVEESLPDRVTFYLPEQTFQSLDPAFQNTTDMKQYFFNTDDPDGLQEKLEEITKNYGLGGGVTNTKTEIEQAKMTVFIVKVLTIGFITLMALICIANIINTLSTSIALRRKEFAMLKSVGMTPKGFRRMIRFESLFYGTKALLWGLPISVLVNYGLYRLIQKGVDYAFFLPWGAYLGAVAAVLLIVGITMAYSMKKVNRETIIDTLKEDNF